MHRILPKIEGPEDLKLLDNQELELLCQEMRDELVRVLSLRPAHFASNLGVVELCVALHLSYDFSKDRIIWDTGHQIYPHKLITGRYRNFDTIRTKGEGAIVGAVVLCYEDRLVGVGICDGQRAGKC